MRTLSSAVWLLLAVPLFVVGCVLASVGLVVFGAGIFVLWWADFIYPGETRGTHAATKD